MKHIFPKLILAAAIAVGTLAACGNDETPETPAATESTVEYAVPKFERDSAYAFIEKQVNFGPRVTNSPGHASTKTWLVEKLKSYGATIIEQDFKAETFDGKVLNGTNIIARYNPQSSKKLLLAAHWDTRPLADSPLSTERRDEPILGADDGGSGVAVLLEVARQLQQNPINMGIDIILFDAEDYGEPRDFEMKAEGKTFYCLGSQHWSKNPHEKGYKYGILLDMVGAKNASFPKEATSMRLAPQVVNKVWKLAQDMGYTNYFSNVHAQGVTDDHYFVGTGAGVPMIDIINLPSNNQIQFGDHWHTHNDNMDIIDPRVLRAVGQVVLAVIYREANGTF